jgi:succinoglycan biosynthesis transport protein ExoP
MMETRVKLMTSNDDSHMTGDAAHGATGVAQPEISDLLGIARRGWLFIVAGTIFGLICAVMLLSIIPPIYKASSRIAFERTTPRYMQANKISNEPIIDDYDAMGTIYVISSEGILLQVVRSLSLATDFDFVGGKDSKTLGSRVRGLFQNVAQAAGFSKELAEDQSKQHDSNPERIALDKVAGDLTATREDVASVITVAFSSKDPVKAATIVNAIVDTYVNESIADKLKSTDVAGKVVQQRVEELKQQAKDAEQAVLEYKIANKLAGSSKATLSAEELATLQTHLANARVAMAEARARMERFARDPDASTVLAPDNPLIAKLRTELLELSVRANDIENRVGKSHEAVIKIRKRMEQVRETIASEQTRIGGSFGKDYELAQARYDALSATLSRVMGEEGANGDVQARLRELESAADTLRSLYNRALQQSTELNKVEAQPSFTPDVRVLNRATPPSQTESSKKRWLILAGGGMMGLFLGFAFVFARDFPFGVFRTPRQVTHATGLPCVVVPEVLSADELASLRTGEYVLDWPYSRFAQTLRSIWAMINIAQRESGAKVICVVSSNPGEGKTTVAINLAAHFSVHSATRVLLIDADFHRQSLTKRIAPDASVGFREALLEPTALAKFVVRKERLNLDALLCPASDPVLNAAELLGSVEMEQLVEVAREAYDLVVIEAPPMAAVVDYGMIARHCNGLLFVVEWGRTSQRLVLECLSDASTLLDRVLCVVLNKVNPSALRSIEYYKGDRFHLYYSDQKSV